MVIAGALYGMQSLGYIRDGSTTPAEAVETAAVGLNVTSDAADAGAQDVIRGDGMENVPEYGSSAAVSLSEAGITVHVCGCVKAPGVYELAADARVYEAVEAAGGFTDEADQSYINLAAPLTDAVKIYIPSCGETLSGETSSGGKVNINTADAQLLQTLPGIGPARAADIIAYRQKNGAFACTEDIMKVPGIKSAAYAKIEGMIAVR